MSLHSGSGLGQRKDAIAKKTRSYQATKTIRRFEGDDWDAHVFAADAMDIYENAHKALMEHDEHIEPPVAVHVRTGDVVIKGNTFGQVTVRFHTRQTLAIYDRHGRLIAGDENKVKDVLEYIVFEKHIANEYGRWRMHGKLQPKWVPPKEPIRPTFVKPEPPKLDEDFEDPEAIKFKSNEEMEDELNKKSIEDDKKKEQIA